MANKQHGFFSHQTLEKNIGWMIIASILVVSFAGLVQIIPLFFQHSTTQAAEGVEPYSPLRLMGRDVYIREGCVGCHSQQVRLLAAEVQRYGSYSLASESVFDHPFLWGSKRTGPDLARLGERYSDEWHRIHLRNPRMVVPESNMPAYPWLEKTSITGQNVQDRMRALRLLGVPYSDEDIAGAPKAIEGKTEEDALVAYLQGLGVGVRKAQQAKKAAAAEEAAKKAVDAARQPAAQPASGG
ncbi:cytochrome-c oxidase, cbb3-type subunit II [Achromobacter sp. Marseille-Q0513]|uniref:cytochrome-c oxidase, cbb3-type subunit II n=1 Tax=Achromobacter sp. Marseille-Q0513 TaxID=2829161 RepID=UPI001B5378FD|nr:cytochrome-c oxidase, cbb3-type subunit II [Achromobacter sp. Marseille-Q0513]MBP6707202.1 cytochrome-c oxidase, cbb3-type subunit II [Achromobacter sp.]MBR8653036.1 cytochrome-c oxidase, cbb3-type subunit II [Achromobacter sp. Marseille-Q0513]